MKLNNNGFAITSLLYGILILFVFLVSSYLLALSAKKNRIDNLINDIEKDIEEEYVCPNINEQFSENPYYIDYEGDYTLNITSITENTSYDCTISLDIGDTISYRDNTIYLLNTTLNNEKEEQYAPFDDQDCYNLVYHKDIESVNTIKYICD